MSHLGELLSALVDGELSGAELDRANAHVATCGDCRVEANALRRLKSELRSLGEVYDLGDITGRLLAVSGESGRSQPSSPAARRPREVRAGGRRPMIDPYLAPSARRIGRRRVRYVLWSTVSVVVVGVGSAAFSLGGSASPAGPQITPQLEVFDAQHAVTSGDVPFEDPASSVRVPVGAATP